MKTNHLFGKLCWTVGLAGLLALWIPAAWGAPPDNSPCATNTERRQLDFWLGEWDVTHPGATKPNVSHVSLDLGRCVVIEHWEGAGDHSGKNMFAYSDDDKRWYGMFADNRGRVHVFEGKVTRGGAEFYGPSQDASGQTALNRIRVTRLSTEKVEQTWEKSLDNGATWRTEFRGEYSRKKP